MYGGLKAVSDQIGSVPFHGFRSFPARSGRRRKTWNPCKTTRTAFADRVPYSAIRPALGYLQTELGIHPTFLLNQAVGRYENGDLKSVSGQRYEKVTALKKRVKRLVDEGRSDELAAIIPVAGTFRFSTWRRSGKKSPSG